MSNSNLHPFPMRPGAKVGIAIPLDQLRDSMREFMSEVADDDNNIYAWPFETYLQWLRKKQETTNVGSRSDG